MKSPFIFHFRSKIENDDVLLYCVCGVCAAKMYPDFCKGALRAAPVVCHCIFLQLRCVATAFLQGCADSVAGCVSLHFLAAAL